MDENKKEEHKNEINDIKDQLKKIWKELDPMRPDSNWKRCYECGWGDGFVRIKKHPIPHESKAEKQKLDENKKEYTEEIGNNKNDKEINDIKVQLKHLHEGILKIWKELDPTQEGSNWSRYGRRGLRTYLRTENKKEDTEEMKTNDEEIIIHDGKQVGWNFCQICHGWVRNSPADNFKRCRMCNGYVKIDRTKNDEQALDPENKMETNVETQEIKQVRKKWKLCQMCKGLVLTSRP